MLIKKLKLSDTLRSAVGISSCTVSVVLQYCSATNSNSSACPYDTATPLSSAIPGAVRSRFTTHPHQRARPHIIRTYHRWPPRRQRRAKQQHLLKPEERTPRPRPPKRPCCKACTHMVNASHAFLLHSAGQRRSNSPVIPNTNGNLFLMHRGWMSTGLLCHH